MEQLALPLPPYRQSYRKIIGPKCPCCKQSLDLAAQRLAVWQNFRAWLLLNWDWAARELIRYQAAHPEGLSLREHPDLLWALQADARAHELELNDRLAEIIDSYFQGEFNDILRRGLKKPSWNYAVVQGLVFAYRSDRPWAGRPDGQSVFLGRAMDKGRAKRAFSAWLKTKVEISLPETMAESGYEAKQLSETAELSHDDDQAAMPLDKRACDVPC